MNNQKLLEKYSKHLEEKGYEKRTVEHLLLGARRFLQWLDDENLTYKECTYSDLMAMLKMYRDEKKSIVFRNRHLWCVRRLYEYLIKEEEVEYNPALNIRIKGEVKILPHELVSRERIDEIYENYKPETPVQVRNKVILSLFLLPGNFTPRTRQAETIGYKPEERHNLYKKKQPITTKNIKVRRSPDITPS